MAGSKVQINIVSMHEDKDEQLSFAVGEEVVGNFQKSISVELDSGDHELRLFSQTSGGLDYSFSLNVDGFSLYQVNFVLGQGGSSDGVSHEFLKANDPTQASADQKPKSTNFQDSIVTLTVLDGRDGSPVEGATVFLHESGEEFLSDSSGKVLVKTQVEVDSPQFVSVFHEEYITQSFPDLLLNAESTDPIRMEPSGLQLQDFVVVSPKMKSSVSALLEIRKNSSSVADMIGAEQISRSGDSSAASSLKRVTGLSLVDGKFVYVRGLGERYSSTLLNGSVLPSPDPSRRVVPLDLFPASVIENMIVQKGFESIMPGEFGGGSIQINTKDSEGEAVSKYSLSRTIDPQEALVTYNGGRWDWTGFGGSSRSLPSEIQTYIDQDLDLSNASADERKELAQSVAKNFNTRKLNSSEKLPFSSLSLGTGNSGNWGRMRWGYNLSSIYANNWEYQTEEREDFNSSGSELVSDSTQEVALSKQKIKLGLLAGLSLSRRTWKASYAASMLRNTQDLVSIATGVNSESEDFRQTDLSWRERSLNSHQFFGNKRFSFLGKSRLNWNYTYSKALLQEPAEKSYVYKLQGDTYELETENASSGNSVSWRKMPDNMHNFLLDFEQDLDLISLGSQLRLGWGRMSRKRNFDSKTYYFQFDGSTSSQVDRTQDPDTVFSHESAELYQQSNQTDNYAAEQRIHSAYVHYALPFDRWKWNVGLRYEDSKQEVESFQLFDAGKTLSRLETFDYFPNASLTYQIFKNSQLKGNFSETVSRPDLREISDTVWVDLAQGAKFKGNPNLTVAEIKNWGLRWEWFFSRGEVLSVGYYRKDFLNPIEEVFGTLDDEGEITGTTDTQYTFMNIDSAVSQGWEFEVRKKLPWNLTFSANYSRISSSVNISDEQAGQLTSSERPLQGQSGYIFNADLGFESSEKTYLFNVLFNSIGRRITGVGVDGRPDEYQEAVSTLDFVGSRKIGDKMKLSLKVKNILDPERKRTQGDKVTRASRAGRHFSIGLKGEF